MRAPATRMNNKGYSRSPSWRPHGYRTQPNGEPLMRMFAFEVLTMFLIQKIQFLPKSLATRMSQMNSQSTISKALAKSTLQMWPFKLCFQILKISSSVATMLSEMLRSLMKVDWDLSIKELITQLSRVARILLIILTRVFMRLIEQKSPISDAQPFLGMRMIFAQLIYSRFYFPSEKSKQSWAQST